MSRILSRRSALVVGAGGLVAACDRVAQLPAAQTLLGGAEVAHRGLQRAITARDALAVEYRPDQRSPIFRANGTNNPNTPDYNAHAANRFADWRVTVDGLVARPLSLRLDQIRSMPSRQQITRHDCVEGWSAIGKWTGPRLSRILDLAGLRPDARYLVFHCADAIGGRPYYESIDLIDAFHPQTILAWALNDRLLGVPNGAPLRLRVERQLGYKHAKYVERIEAVASLTGLAGGKGGFWEDVAGYDWYAGI
ncbi:molybdopterin-binding protein [Sphingomonas sp. Leaf5]|uniref:molybdopterin-dependent oxidoreductase n=1 Tax=Sphingomonas sp. Leaf5 TaxID=1735671 RepID=UPI0006F66897|nr:molybdopterin-dependent oxidoreductase [Sphingomonas sp. Leaf5]KQM22599.1 molybdopterin-binding protein [Sphingomonas sp. Leaf5]